MKGAANPAGPGAGRHCSLRVPRIRRLADLTSEGALRADDDGGRALQFRVAPPPRRGLKEIARLHEARTRPMRKSSLRRDRRLPRDEVGAGAETLGWALAEVLPPTQ